MTLPFEQRAPTFRLLVLEGVIVFALLFMTLQTLFGVCRFSIFLARDLDRARLLSAGHLILFGPEASGGGHLPGSFYYFLLAAPLRLGFGWKATWQLQIAMMSGAYSALWIFFRRRFGLFPACYALFCASFFNFATLLYGYNAGYTPLFTVAALILLCRAFDSDCEGRGAAWLGFCVICGLGIQLHYTFLQVFLSGVILQASSPSLKLRPLPLRKFSAGLLSFLLMLLPYAVWLAGARLSRPIGQQVLPFTGTQAVNVRIIAAHARFVLGWLPASVLARRDLGLIPFEALLPAAAAILFCATQQPELGDEADAARRSLAETCVKVLAVASAATLFSFGLALALMPIRYADTPRLCLDLLAGAVLARHDARLRRGAFYPVTLAGVCLLTAAWHGILWPGWMRALDFRQTAFAVVLGAMLALVVYLNRTAPPSFTELFTVLLVPLVLSLAVQDASATYARYDFPGVSDLEAMSREIYARTGWSYDEARVRIFYVNVRDVLTPAYVYRDIEARARPPAPRTAAAKFGADGYFAAFLADDPDAESAILRPRDLVLSPGIVPMLADAIKRGSIQLGTPAAAGRFVLIPYKVMDTEHLPRYFHNSSEGYALDALAPGFPEAPGQRTFRFLFNDCPQHAAACDVAADVRLRPRKRGHWNVDVVFSGQPLTQASDGVNMMWLETLSHPYFSAACRGRERRVLLADSLGIHPSRSRNMNGDLLGPYARSFDVDCGGPPQFVTVGYESATAFVMTRALEPRLKARALSARMNP